MNIGYKIKLSILLAIFIISILYYFEKFGVGNIKLYSLDSGSLVFTHPASTRELTGASIYLIEQNFIGHIISCDTSLSCRLVDNNYKNGFYTILSEESNELLFSLPLVGHILSLLKDTFVVFIFILVPTVLILLNEYSIFKEESENEFYKAIVYIRYLWQRRKYGLVKRFKLLTN